MIENGMILVDERERKPDGYCDECDSPLYYDDCYYEFDGYVYCEDCARKHRHVIMPR